MTGEKMEVKVQDDERVRYMALADAARCYVRNILDRPVDDKGVVVRARRWSVEGWQAVARIIGLDFTPDRQTQMDALAVLEGKDPNPDAAYVCPQCGPDPRGPDIHAEDRHTWRAIEEVVKGGEGEEKPAWFDGFHAALMDRIDHLEALNEMLLEGREEAKEKVAQMNESRLAAMIDAAFTQSTGVCDHHPLSILCTKRMNEMARLLVVNGVRWVPGDG